MSQTSYPLTLTAAYAGGHGQIDHVRTARNNSGAELPYGRAVVFDTGSGTSDLAAKLPSASGDQILGVALYDHAHEPQTTGIPDDAVFSVVTEGEVYVEVEQAITPNDPVFVRYDAAGATGTNPAVGKFRKDADTGKAVAATNMRFMTSAAAGGLARVRLNLP